MSRMSALVATAVILSFSPLVADARDKSKAPEAAAESKTQAVAKAPPKAPPVKATPAERAMVQSLEPLARVAFWSREADRDPADAEAAMYLSQGLRALGRLDEAAQIAQRATLLAPRSQAPLMELARVQIARNQGFYAIEPLRQAMALAPRDWRPVSMLGVAYEQASRDDEALAAHRQAVALAPDSPAAIGNLAMFYASHGDAAQAETLLRQAIAKPGADMTVRQNLALLLGLQGRFDEAERIARQDLPPEVVANNMAYLRAAAAPTGTAVQRSWEAMRSAQ